MILLDENRSCVEYPKKLVQCFNLYATIDNKYGVLKQTRVWVQVPASIITSIFINKFQSMFYVEIIYKARFIRQGQTVVIVEFPSDQYAINSSL